ncbi:MAG TPA: glutamate--tRNA ligase [Candidatus Nanoarchaeia archaeon]|nr:glutamate--tRNA ligase [Candidatus Nanoarchaeia archaeon]
MREIILKYSLKNALDFDGKVNQKAVLGLTLRENPALKSQVPKVLQEIAEITREVENLNLEEIKKKLEKIFPQSLIEKKEEILGPLKHLPNAEKGKVVVRIAPSPSGPLHIGHAYGASLNYEYAKMYQGKFILRIEDTNAENIHPPAYEMIVDDANWLTGNGINQVIIQSSRLGIYYDYAEKLVQMGKAYLCTCNSEEWIKLKNKCLPCKCRELGIKENQLRYAKLFNEYTEGEAVLRLKTDIKDKNPAMRDFALMRIVEHIHPKTGKEQRVWPLMIFSVAIDDHELGITHVLNGKDHADNAIKEQLIMKYLDWKPPQYRHWGRINFEGFELSTSKTRKAIEEGKYSGWEDIRLPFLRALRKRGYQPEAFRKFAIEIGLSLNDKTVSITEFWKNINSFNREIIEPKANRYFFIKNPVSVKIVNAPKKTVKIDLHPDHPERGQRVLIPHQEVHLAEEDYEQLTEGRLYRLMDYCNFEVKAKKFIFVSESYDDYKKAEKKGSIIHWLPAEEKLVIEVLMEDKTTLLGLGEKMLKELKVGDIIQLERMFFARLDQKEGNKLLFWYLHK